MEIALHNTNSSNADICHGTLGATAPDILPNAKHLSVVEMSAFTDILGEAAWSHT